MRISPTVHVVVVLAQPTRDATATLTLENDIYVFQVVGRRICRAFKHGEVLYEGSIKSGIACGHIKSTRIHVSRGRLRYKFSNWNYINITWGKKGRQCDRQIKAGYHESLESAVTVKMTSK